MKAPITTIKLMTRDQQTEVVSISVPETYEPYDVIIWQGRFFIPTPNNGSYHEAVSFYAVDTR